VRIALLGRAPQSRVAAAAAVMLALVVLVTPAQGSKVEPPRRTALEESNLVVTRFLVASALGDRRTACALFPSHQPCQHGNRFVGPAEFEVVRVTLADPKRPAVSAKVGGVEGSFVLARSGSSFVIVGAERALARVLRANPGSQAQGKPVRRSAQAEASLVVTRFLLAAALEDRRTGCAMFPAFFYCQRGHRFRSTAQFNVVSVSLADPMQPVVVANVGGIRGYFVLERAKSSFVIVRAEAD
jgi:hypothetical protein